MKMKGYDKWALNKQMLLDLQFTEGTGILARDSAKPHHDPITVVDPGGGVFSWASLATGQPYVNFAPAGGGPADGVYLECDAADSADLNFTTGDYSIGGWINMSSTGQSLQIINRYALDTDGWELYWYDFYLTLRHHHAGEATDRTACYSYAWGTGAWYFMGISRSGGYARMYRNGVALAMGCSDGGLIDPATANRDLLLGARFTKDADWYKGYQSRMRVWGRSLTAADWAAIFNSERHWYGV